MNGGSVSGNSAVPTPPRPHDAMFQAVPRKGLSISLDSALRSHASDATINLPTPSAGLRPLQVDGMTLGKSLGAP